MAALVAASAAFPGLAETSVAAFWWTHVGLACLGVALGRAALFPADGALIARAGLGGGLFWWARSLAVALALAVGWLAALWTATRFDPLDPAARVFLAMAFLSVAAAHAGGALWPRRFGWGVAFPLAAWALFYGGMWMEPEAFGHAETQVAWTSLIGGGSLAASAWGHVRRLGA